MMALTVIAAASHPCRERGRIFCRVLVFIALFAIACSDSCEHGAVMKETPPASTSTTRTVVLTFDDGSRSHFDVVRPMLLRHGFGATFFVTEGFRFRTDKRAYMTWEQIAQLDADGFEIGNHTASHYVLKADNVSGLNVEIEAIERSLAAHGVPKPVSFGYAGRGFGSTEVFEILRSHGYRLARRGGYPEHSAKTGRGVTFEPGRDHPLFIPATAVPRQDWSAQQMIDAVERARDGHIAVLAFHGVPDLQHPEVLPAELPS
jgi:peptidoglycan-N-acetylglucosamine deacetylase